MSLFEFADPFPIKKFTTEELTSKIKYFFDKKIIFIENNKIIVNFEIISEDTLYIDDDFVHGSKEFDEILRKEIKLRGLQNYKLHYLKIPVDNEISNIRKEHLNKLVSVKGIITNITSLHTLTIKTKWECLGCGSMIFKPGYEKPKGCSCSETQNFKKIESEFADIQELVLEEDYNNIGNKNPKKVKIRLLNELCDKGMNDVIIPGTRVEIIGVVELVPLPPKNNKTREEISEFRVRALQVNSLEDEFDETITDEDIKEMEEIANNNPFEILSQTIAPNIKGKDNEKKSLLLAMTRGTPTIKSDGRSDKETIHILFIGDPGQAKTDMLTACARLHYKGGYADCTGMTPPGITATVENDKLTGAWNLKPGLLVIRNKGLQILDEFDKSNEDTKLVLHTPLESGIITINKASINTTLNADCTVIIGANPKLGKFDLAQPLVGQIKLPPTIMDRMDLILTFIDNIEEEKDSLIADSVLNLTNETIEVIDIKLFKKYLKYIQKFKPTLNNESAEFLKDKYLKIRQMSKNSDGISGMPISVRQLKAMKRLSEAHAKLRMSNEVTKEDVEVTYKLFKNSLVKLGLREDGIFDMSRCGSGVTLNNKEKRQNLLEFIHAKKAEQEYVTKDELDEFSEKMKITSTELDKFISSLLQEAQIFSPKYGQYKYVG